MEAGLVQAADQWNDLVLSLLLRCPRTSERYAAEVADLTCEWESMQSPAERRILLRDTCKQLHGAGEIVLIVPNRLSYRHIQRYLGLLRLPIGMLRRGEPQEVDVPERSTSRQLTLRGYRKFLERSGFRYCEFHQIERHSDGALAVVRPDETLPRTRSARRPLGLARWIKQSQYFAPEFAIRASPEPLSPASIYRILRDLAGHIDEDPTSVSLRTLLVSVKEKAIATAQIGRRTVVLKIPLSDSALQGCRVNQRGLEHGRKRQALAEIIPQPFTMGILNGLHFSSESAVKGVPLKQAGPSQLSRSLALIEKLLLTIRTQDADSRRGEFVGELYSRQVEQPLARARHLFPEKRLFDAVERFFHSELHGVELVFGLTHGDLSLNNVFVDAGEITGVIDWDDSHVLGIPVLDGISHLCSRQFGRSQDCQETFLSLAEGRWPIDEERAFLARIFESSETDRRYHRALVLLYWLHSISANASFAYAHQPDFARTRVLPIARRIADAH
jgi:hypothetical protein